MAGWIGPLQLVFGSGGLSGSGEGPSVPSVIRFINEAIGKPSFRNESISRPAFLREDIRKPAFLNESLE